MLAIGCLDFCSLAIPMPLFACCKYSKKVQQATVCGFLRVLDAFVSDTVVKSLAGREFL